jgi:hypothetical protein
MFGGKNTHLAGRPKCTHYTQWLPNVLSLVNIFLKDSRTTIKKGGLQCLTPLSTISQLYHGGKFYWWRKPGYQEKTTDLSLTLSHNIVFRRVLCLVSTVNSHCGKQSQSKHWMTIFISHRKSVMIVFPFDIVRMDAWVKLCKSENFHGNPPFFYYGCHHDCDCSSIYHYLYNQCLSLIFDLPIICKTV